MNSSFRDYLDHEVETSGFLMKRIHIRHLITQLSDKKLTESERDRLETELYDECGMLNHILDDYTFRLGAVCDAITDI